MSISPEPIHEPGTRRAEDVSRHEGRTHSRPEGKVGARRPAGRAKPSDATGINPEKRASITPGSVYIPPP
jgi:hypothetical protein